MCDPEDRCTIEPRVTFRDNDRYFSKQSLLRNIYQAELKSENFIGHVKYRVIPSTLDTSVITIIGEASAWAQDNWNWPEQAMRVSLQRVSNTVFVSKDLHIAESLRGNGYSKKFFNFYSNVAFIMGAKTLLAFVSGTNLTQFGRLKKLGWVDMGTYGEESTFESCTAPHIFRKEL